MWKRFNSGYLNFTKRERTGILMLLLFIVFFIILPFLYPFFIKEKTYDHHAFEKAIASLRIQQADSAGQEENGNFKKYSHQQTQGRYDARQRSPGELFYFDPNTANPDDWKKLGIPDKTIATIQNYLSKGGRFYKSEDIGKIWGLHKEDAQRLIPYIRIQNAGSANYQAEKIYERKDYKNATNTVITVDINMADTSAFIALPGIGSKLSQRIIHFRDKLGGFYTVEQIGETFGLPDSTFQKIKPYLKISHSELRRININTATIDDMKSHPYLRFAIANAIVQYRSQHGLYTVIDDIKNIMSVTEEVFDKISPYLTVN